MGTFLTPPPGETQLRAPRLDEGADIVGNLAGRSGSRTGDVFSDLAKLLTRASPAIQAGLQGLGGGGAGSQAAVLPGQVVRALEWARAHPETHRAPQHSPGVIGSLLEMFRNPDVAQWAKNKWKNIGGAGETAVGSLPVGAEAFPMQVLPFDPPVGRDPMTVLKLYGPDPFQQRAYSQAIQNIPHMLPSISHGRHPYGTLSYIEQPFANMMSKNLSRNNPIYVQNMLDNINRDLLKMTPPRAIIDPHAGNFGEYRGQWYVVDPGAIGKISRSMRRNFYNDLYTPTSSPPRPNSK